MKNNALGFDPIYLKQKYRAERDKRLRQDGVYQYLETKGNLSHFKENDPYLKKEIREPIESH